MALPPGAGRTIVPDLPDLPPVRAAGDREVLDGVTYARPAGFRPLLMDVHLPVGRSGALPCVVWIHGGGWREGDRRYPPGNWGHDDRWFRLLVASGMAVATIDYRLSGEAHHPAQLADAQAAIRFLRHHADALGIAPDRIGVSGESAGGHLAALVALTGDDPVDPTDRSVLGPSSAVAAAVPMYPVTDLLAFGPDEGWSGPYPEDLLLGQRVTEVPTAARAASPITHVHHAAPPMLLLHGGADTLVPPGHSERLAAALAAVGAPIRLELVPGGEHCFVGADPAVPLESAVAFLAEHLGASARAGAGPASKVYVDMVGDLFHAGHVAFLREARSHGDWLVVGVLSDETVASCKRRPIMTLAERVAVIEACRYVDEVIAGAPDRVTAEFLDEHAISVVVHGDDLSLEGAETVYGPAVADGRFAHVPRTSDISTTSLIQRVLDRASGGPACREDDA